MPFPLTGYPVRLGFFGIAIAFLYGGVFAVIESQGSSAGIENGPLELMQVGCAIFASVVFLAAAWHSRRGIVGLTVCGAMMAYAAARESDQWFEALLFDDAYKWLVGIPAIVLVTATAWRHRKGILRETYDLLDQPAATMFIIAGVYLAFVCQMLDRPTVWAELSSDVASITIKPLIEEAMEVFAYATIAYSSIESMLFARRSASQRVVSAELNDAVIRIAA